MILAFKAAIVVIIVMAVVGFLGYKARLNISIVTSKDITDFRDRRESFGLAPSTLAHRLSV